MVMAPWLDEYIAALEVRDFAEKANHEFYSACEAMTPNTVDSRTKSS